MADITDLILEALTGKPTGMPAGDFFDPRRYTEKMSGATTLLPGMSQLPDSTDGMFGGPNAPRTAASFKQAILDAMDTEKLKNLGEVGVSGLAGLPGGVTGVATAIGTDLALQKNRANRTLDLSDLEKQLAEQQARKPRTLSRDDIRRALDAKAGSPDRIISLKGPDENVGKDVGRFAVQDYSDTGEPRSTQLSTAQERLRTLIARNRPASEIAAATKDLDSVTDIEKTKLAYGGKQTIVDQQQRQKNRLAARNLSSDPVKLNAFANQNKLDPKLLTEENLFQLFEQTNPSTTPGTTGGTTPKKSLRDQIAAREANAPENKIRDIQKQIDDKKAAFDPNDTWGDRLGRVTTAGLTALAAKALLKGGARLLGAGKTAAAGGAATATKGAEDLIGNLERGTSEEEMARRYAAQQADSVDAAVQAARDRAANAPRGIESVFGSNASPSAREFAGKVREMFSKAKSPDEKAAVMDWVQRMLKTMRF